MRRSCRSVRNSIAPDTKASLANALMLELNLMQIKLPIKSSYNSMLTLKDQIINMKIRIMYLLAKEIENHLEQKAFGV